jgi:hypothetical protein
LICSSLILALISAFIIPFFSKNHTVDGLGRALENTGSRPLSHSQAGDRRISSWVGDDQRIPAFGKKKNGAGSPYGNQQALFIFFYCVQAETKKKINYLFFFTLPA